MVALHGKAGNVKIASASIAEIDTWELDVDRATHDTTKFNLGNNWKTFLPGLVGAVGKLNGRLDMTDTNGQLAMFNSFTSDTPLTLSLYLDAVHNFAVSVFITKLAGKAPVNNLETGDWDFQITGPAVYT